MSAEKLIAAGIIGLGGAVVAGSMVLLYASAGSLSGAICGEILDHVPYLSHAIPEGIGYLANYIAPDAAQKATLAMEGNLDKLGAAMGFIGGFYKAHVSS